MCGNDVLCAEFAASTTGAAITAQNARPKYRGAHVPPIQMSRCAFYIIVIAQSVLMGTRAVCHFDRAQESQWTE
jgi:hypothetical protein